MALIKNGRLIEDLFVNAVDADTLPAGGAVMVSLEQWQADRPALIKRGQPLGIRLNSDQAPAVIAGDLDRFSVVALEFPSFRDGRAYSYARLLRERYGFRGELRAVGDVLLEQLHYMQRVGFDAFEIDSEHAMEDWQTAMAEFSAWYQPAADRRETAVELRHRRRWAKSA